MCPHPGSNRGKSPSRSSMPAPVSRRCEGLEKTNRQRAVVGARCSRILTRHCGRKLLKRTTPVSPTAVVRQEITRQENACTCGPQHEGRIPHQHREMVDCGADGLAPRRNRASRLKGAGRDDSEVSARPPIGRQERGGGVMPEVSPAQNLP